MKIKKILAILCTLSVFCCNDFAVFASEADVLKPYEEKLAEINNELGTSYKIPDANELSVTGMTEAELISFYTAMDMDEFESYILEMDENNQTEEIIVLQSPYNKNGISLSATSSTQKYYYSTSNNNYLYIKTSVSTSGGKKYYSSINSLGSNSTATGYPYYSVKSYSYSKSSNSRQVTCSYKCSKYLSSTIIDTGSYTVKVTFTAGGGDLYATTTV